MILNRHFAYTDKGDDLYMNIKWNAKDYRNNFSFVPQYGKAVTELITAEKGSTVIDLGCGNGSLSHTLKDMGFNVIGIDESEEMIALAKENNRDIEFYTGNALDFHVDKKADVIFSNAVFHWIDKDKQDILTDNISKQLKKGGELVCEFGGYGCAEAVHSTLEKTFYEKGIVYPRTFYFPTIGEYTPLLEKHGLMTEYATLFDRPTPQQTENGLTDWINMFVKTPFEGMDENMRNDIINEANDMLYPILFQNGRWFIDYVRIRIRARKI